jgi:hypothetical protein
VSARLNLNLTTAIIEEVVGKCWKVTAELCANLKKEVSKQIAEWAASTQGEDSEGEVAKFRSVLETKVLQQLDDVSSHDISEYNDDEKFLNLTQAAFAAKHAGGNAQVMTACSGGLRPNIDAKKVFESVKTLCASAGELQGAPRAGWLVLEDETLLIDVEAIARPQAKTFLGQVRSQDTNKMEAGKAGLLELFEACLCLSCRALWTPWSQSDSDCKHCYATFKRATDAPTETERTRTNVHFATIAIASALELRAVDAFRKAADEILESFRATRGLTTIAGVVAENLNSHQAGERKVACQCLKDCDGRVLQAGGASPGKIM